MKSIGRIGIAALILVMNSSCAYTLMSSEDRMLASGQFSKAEILLENELRTSSTPKSISLIKLCYIYSKLKNYNKLFAFLDQLESNIKKGDKIIYGYYESTGIQLNFPADITAFPRLLRAEAFIELGNYRKAIDLARTAYELSQAMDWPSVDRLTNWDIRCQVRALGLLALAHALNGDRHAALQVVKQLENTNVPFSSGIPIKKERSLGLARAYVALGFYGKILENKAHLLDAITGLSDIVLGSSFTGLNIYAYADLPRDFLLNKSLYETGHTAEAKQGYDALLRNPDTRSNGEIYWAILFDKGRIAEAEGNLKEAIDLYEKSIEIIEAQRSTINTEASKIGFVGDKQQVYHHIISALFATSQYTTAFEYVERAKSRALVDLLAADRHLAPESSKVSSMLTELDKLDLEAKAQDAGAMIEDVNKRRTRSIEIKEKIRDTAPELYSLVSVSVPSPSEIQSTIEPGETIIEYYYFDQDLYAFVVTGNAIKSVKLAGDNLVRDIKDLRLSFENPETRDYLTLSRKVYNRLIEPVRHLISTQKLVIVPHGILHYLPFNALYDGNEYLIDRYYLSYLPSSSVMKFLKERKTHGSGQVLVFGNPDLGDPRYNLKYAEKEALAVAKALPGSKVLLRTQATETAFKNGGGGFPYIHFATHGTFDAASPLNSGIFLRQDSQNDGLLSVGELYSLRLNAELVTLSACETGMGTIKSGDDIVGLTRGFLYAGSNAIIASLWKVDDLATSKLMAELYSGLGEADKRVALREAQLAVKKQYRHPYYWAAFQITGRTE